MDKVNFAVIGNLAYDYNYFPNRSEEVVNLGGATLYSGVPASLFVKVGIAAKVGEDYDFSVFDNLNFDLAGVKQVEGKTTVFIHEFQSDDGQERLFTEKVNPNTYLKPTDIPDEYLKAKYIHVCTNYPLVQYELVKYLKANSDAIISIDTLEDYYYDEEQFEIIKKSFDLVNIAFIDKEFKKLFDCSAPVKIIKLGKDGCRYISKEKDFQVAAPFCEFVVDKTGAGDCVTGVFGALKTLDYSDEEALQIAVNIATESIKDHGIFHLYEKDINKELIEGKC